MRIAGERFRLSHTSENHIDKPRYIGAAVRPHAKKGARRLLSLAPLEKTAIYYFMSAMAACAAARRARGTRYGEQDT